MQVEPGGGFGEAQPLRTSDGEGHGVAEALGRLCDMAALRRPDDPLLVRFLPLYYSELPAGDVDDRKLDDIYAVAVAHLALARVRAPGQSVVRVLAPDRERDGWESDHSVLLVVTDDMPFLVDTMRMVLERNGLGVHLLVHPMLSVRRDDAHRLVDVASDVVRPGASGGVVEAWTQIEIDRTDDATARALEDEVTAAVDDVRRAVDDFPAMRDRMEALGAVDPLLPWLAEGQFVFLGAADYDVAPDGGLSLRVGSELGLARTQARFASPRPMAGAGPVVVARTDDTSEVFRAERRTVVAVTPPGERVQRRFVGLLATNAYRVSALDIPGIGAAVADALDLDEARMHSHTGRAMRTVLENLPRELLLEVDPTAVARLVAAIVGLQERQVVRVFEVPEPVGPWVTVLVYLPRSRFTAELPERIADTVARTYGADRRTFEPHLGSSSLARITVSVRCPDPRTPVDLDGLEHAIDEQSRSWAERLRAVLVADVGEVEARRLFADVGSHAPAAYRAGVPPERAEHDVRRIADLLASDDEMTTSLARGVGAPPGEWRFRVYRRAVPAALSELLPLLDHLGLQALDEEPYTFHVGDERVFVYDIGVRVPPDVDLDHVRRRGVQDAFAALVAGTVEGDGFNRLVLRAGLSGREVTIVRGYAKYLRQIGFAFSQTYIEDTLSSHPRLVADLVALFHARFDPTRFDGVAGTARDAAQAEVRARVVSALDAIPSLDDDRICRMFLTLVDATVRTNYYRDRPALSFKLDPAAIAELPQPRPRHEIWVCGPRVEGVHLRGGDIARGGLRWSDRREDFRTEVLGLMKAQMVKNAVIVPRGAKGGFVVKRPPADPESMRAEVVECYRAFIRSLLDLTDNLMGAGTGGGSGPTTVVHPPDTVVHDGDDPYFVVAADKGTATFSDIANEISLQYGYWLGDAFASGGSAGYDHKAMGITARGAWESVRRHAGVLGRNADTDPLTAVGVGDMSGDVFGNGMLRSRALRLVAAFDHRHVFIDPDPDPAVAFDERRRLFELPRSSWADYDATRISAGGGVYPRTAKSIDLSDRARAVLGVGDGPLTPNQLVSAVLRAPVDLLWNGGIGTYVKATSESHADVGDRANDAVRVNGAELRCRMIGEGGNLGLTQLGRVEYALAGGLVYTDAIDNSAGVDCSDHEVNIKILLDGIVDAGQLTTDQRNDVLVSMTDEVAELVLDHNRAQTLALVIARRQALPMVNVHARYIDVLEAEGWLDRGLEHLPTDKQIAERQAAGNGLQAPELAVLIAYTKNANVAEMERSDLPEVDLLVADLVRYFPSELRRRYPEAIRRHPLRREIISTAVVNQMVNLSGISFDHRMTEDTGASVVDVTRAWIVAREVFGFADLWAEIEALTGQVPLDTQLDLFLDCRRMVERATLWLLRHRRPPIAIASAVTQFQPGIAALARGLEPVLVGKMAAVVHSVEASRLTAGVPEDLAERAGVWPLLHTGFDLVEVAAAHGRDVVDVARVEWEVLDRLDLTWLWDGIGALPRSDRWQTQARSALRDDLLTALAELTTTVIDSADGSVERWIEVNERSVARVTAMFTEIRRAESYDLTTLSVALRQLRNLALTSVTAVTRSRLRRALIRSRHIVRLCKPSGHPEHGLDPSRQGPEGLQDLRSMSGCDARAPYNWALARQTARDVRAHWVEDTDEARDRPEWTQGIIDALAWLGIGADDPVFEGPYFQSANAAEHVAAAERLYATGQAYYCDLTSEQVQARSKETGRPGYDGYSRDRGLEPGPGRVLRFRVPEGTTVVHDTIRGEVTFAHDSLEDFVLLRGNGRPIFVLANVVDDIAMGITHVVRGEEHLPNTPKQQLLWQALGHEPPQWAHVPVLVNESRKKLSKRRDKVALEQYRDDGYLADAMVNYLMTLGWAPKGDTEIVPWSQIEADFRLEDVTHSPAFFDLKKLNAFNSEYIRALPVEAFIEACEPWIPAHYDRARFAAVAPLLQTRVVTLAEAPPMVDFLFMDDPVIDEASWSKAMAAEWAGPLLDGVIASFADVAWDGPTLKDDVERIGAAAGVNRSKSQAPVRVAVTGRSVGPPLYDSLELLGRDETLRRLRAARERVGA